MKKTLAILFVCCSASGMALADCPGTSTPEIEHCLLLEARQAERELLVAYTDKLRMLEGGYDTPENQKKMKRSFVRAQQQWLKFRDADCQFIYESYGNGSGRNVGAISCQIELTRLRIKELKELFSQ